MSNNAEADARKDSQRKRRAHKKSRKGCRNCKLRKIKCDEARPNCLKCSGYGYACNYDPRMPDLELACSGTSSTIKLPTNPGESPWPITRTTNSGKPNIPTTLEPPCTIGDGISFFELDRQSLCRLDHFRRRTVSSLLTPAAAGVFQEFAIPMACNYPFLMHTLQTLTACHDRYLTLQKGGSSQRTPAEIYHLARAASLFNQKLCRPIAYKDKDVLWATAALLGIVAMSSIEASSPYDAWPLTPYADHDLDWLRMSECKSAVFELTDPTRKDSIFHVMSIEYDIAHYGSDEKPDLSSFPSHFAKLFDLDEYSNSMNNPYYSAIMALGRIMKIECNRSALLSFFRFLTTMSPQLKILLKMRDPRALILLAYWYLKTRTLVWWVERRATLECQAICIYLERHHGDNSLIQETVRGVKRESGLIN
ncbi:97145071-95b0-4e2d-b7f8-a6ec2358420b [Sclerotinia trifoliorum]|uniref:97145071-95b0-4e2d-b7f8-a6ec2358420b n=1 Tax=Sclerotinia trifoliorum TaxID=28548 RepID=A0A8H2ZPR3_9HELO|nr:97145071-95b0-4e2d-b7f8-a6ec2358420b [Sclerotinia trifoliorum]